MNNIYQAVTFKGLSVGVKAAFAKEALKKGFHHLVGDIKVTEDAKGNAVINGQLKNYDVDISEFKTGVGGRIYDLISPYDIQYELQKALGKKIALRDLYETTHIDSAAKVGDRVEAEFGW